ncbi:MAG: HoxN/HupN/NixA family nickel/cobalt transporter [Acidihalobacter sp.]
MNYLNRALQGIPRRPLAVLLLTLAGFNLLSWIGAFGLASIQPSILGLAGLAWVFGARHAFDVDHIAAIDNVTRKLRQEGKRPVAVGFFFALGHSTIVIALSAVVALGARGMKAQFGEFSDFGGIFGTSVSATFLTLIGLINLVVLWQLVKAWRDHRRGRDTRALREEDINALLDQRGFFANIFRFLFRRVSRSWHMYPLGVLFGLGFDTATEIAILGISATLATTSDFPLWGIMIFPFLFTAGMTLMDSLDGLVMLRAYHWALSDAVRRLYFNTIITAMAVGTALVIGTLEWLQLLGPRLGADGPFWSWLDGLDFGTIGVAVVLLMLATWALAIVYYRLRVAPGAALAEQGD